MATAVDGVLLEGGTTTYTDVDGKTMKITVESAEPEVVGKPGQEKMRNGKGKGAGKQAAPKCDKCDGPHPSDECPYFKGPREEDKEPLAGDKGRGKGKGKDGKGGKGKGKGRRRFRHRKEEAPIVLEDPVWGRWEFPSGTEPTPYDVVCWSSCPCCVHGYLCKPACGGKCRRPGMTSDKKKAWIKYLTTFALWLSILQTAALVYSIWGLGDGIDSSSGWLLGPTAQPLIDMGAKWTWAMLEKNEWWRLAAPIMLHGGWVHLFLNISMQVRIGANLEVEWGHLRWIIIYAVSGIYSFTLSAALLPKSVSVGCSGSLMGLMGAWFVWAWITWSKERELITRVIELLVLGTSILIVICQSWLPRVDWAAHAGGVLAGIALAMLLFSPKLTIKLRKYATMISGGVLLLALWAGALIPLILMDPDDAYINLR